MQCDIPPLPQEVRRPRSESPLERLRSLADTVRDEIVGEIVTELGEASLEAILRDALRRGKTRPPATRWLAGLTARRKSERFWLRVEADLTARTTRPRLDPTLRRVAAWYVDGIATQFDRRVYDFVIRSLPWGFNWFLYAARDRRVIPWRLPQGLAARVRIEGRTRALRNLVERGTVLLVPTHQSHLDILIVGYALDRLDLPPFAWAAGVNLFSNPLLGTLLRRAGAFGVDRDDSTALYRMTLGSYSRRLLREGVHSVLFAGGGRSRSGAVECELRRGLLGSALAAQLEMRRAGHPKPHVFLVPVVVSYPFVLEAGSMIDRYLAERGGHLGAAARRTRWRDAPRYFWKTFARDASAIVRIGEPMDVLGRPLDDAGKPMARQGVVDAGEVERAGGGLREAPECLAAHRRELACKIVDCFYRENTVLPSHTVAFTLFEILRRRWPQLALSDLVTLPREARSVPHGEFLREAKLVRSRLVSAEKRQLLRLSPELARPAGIGWVGRGVEHLGLFHEPAVVGVRDGMIFADDISLLYYYRNRLSGYGLSLDSEGELPEPRGRVDEGGFLV